MPIHIPLFTFSPAKGENVVRARMYIYARTTFLFPPATSLFSYPPKTLLPLYL
jgi:hypothetical protein